MPPKCCLFGSTKPKKTQVVKVKAVENPASAPASATLVNDITLSEMKTPTNPKFFECQARKEQSKRDLYKSGPTGRAYLKSSQAFADEAKRQGSVEQQETNSVGPNGIKT